MNTDRLWIFGAVAAIIVIALGGWFVGISPVVTQAAAADEQVASVTQSNADSQARLALLRQQYSNIGPLRTSLDSFRKSIPEGADASVFLQELDDLSGQQGVTIMSVTIASATVYKAPTVPAAATATTTTGTTTPTPTPTATAPATAPATSAASASGQFVQIPVLITVAGDFDAIRGFIGALQLGPRLYLSTAAGISQGGGTTSNTGTLTGYIFTLQGTSDTPASKTPKSTPTPAPTSTPVPTGTATPNPTNSPTPGATTTPSP